MWAALPKDLMLHLGTFVHHRDARCLQATCTKWERTWTGLGLMSPHPAVQQIGLCTVGHCINRQYIIDNLEPFLAQGEARGTIYRVLQFMVLLVPVRALASVGRVLRLLALERHCIDTEKTLVFWCNCTFHAYRVRKPEVCLLGWTPVKEPDARYEPDSLCVWGFVLLLMSIPTSVCAGILGFTYGTGYFLYRTLLHSRSWIGL